MSVRDQPFELARGTPLARQCRYRGANASKSISGGMTMTSCSSRWWRRVVSATVAGLLVISCTRESSDRGQVRPKGKSNATAPIARQIAWLGDLHQPEGVKYDADQDVFFISNMNSFGSAKDGNGYIVEVKAAHCWRKSMRS